MKASRPTSFAAETFDARMTTRFLILGRHAVSLGSDAILFTCSAFGPCIGAVRAGPISRLCLSADRMKQ